MQHGSAAVKVSAIAVASGKVHCFTFVNDLCISVHFPLIEKRLRPLKSHFKRNLAYRTEEGKELALHQ